MPIRTTRHASALASKNPSAKAGGPFPAIFLKLAWTLAAPLLAWQGIRTRQRTPRLPEAAGLRMGIVGAGPVGLRLLIVGDSSAAGVGSTTQQQALAGRLAQALVQQHGYAAVAWQLVARNGHTVRSARQHAAATELRRADVLVTVFGVNDAIERHSGAQFVRALDALVGHVHARTSVRCVVHCAPPLMGLMPALPQPLRWILGAQAGQLDRALKRHLVGHRRRTRFEIPFDPEGERASEWLAADGFHPNEALYARWALALAAHIDVDLHTVPEAHAVRPSGFHSLFDLPTR